MLLGRLQLIAMQKALKKLKKRKKKFFFDKFFSDFLQFKSEQTHKQYWMGSFNPPAL